MGRTIIPALLMGAFLVGSHAVNTPSQAVDRGVFDLPEVEGAALSEQEWHDALHQLALLSGTTALSTLGEPNAFDQVPARRIPLLSEFSMLKPSLKRAGIEMLENEMRVAINRAAEMTAPHASVVYVRLLDGVRFPTPKNAFCAGPAGASYAVSNVMRGELVDALYPIVARQLERTLAQKIWQRSQQLFLAEQGNRPEMVSVFENVDLTSYVLQQFIDRWLSEMMQQEMRIRNNPEQTGHAMLQRALHEWYAMR